MIELTDKECKKIVAALNNYAKTYASVLSSEEFTEFLELIYKIDVYKEGK